MVRLKIWEIWNDNNNNDNDEKKQVNLIRFCVSKVNLCVLILFFVLFCLLFFVWIMLITLANYDYQLLFLIILSFTNESNKQTKIYIHCLCVYQNWILLSLFFSFFFSRQKCYQLHIVFIRKKFIELIFFRLFFVLHP